MVNIKGKETSQSLYVNEPLNSDCGHKYGSGILSLKIYWFFSVSFYVKFDLKHVVDIFHFISLLTVLCC